MQIRQTVWMSLLLRACHPLPAAAVTVVTALLAVGMGLSAGTAALATGTIGLSQLAIGWSNDAIDASRDRAADRPDKPLAALASTAQAKAGHRTVAVAAVGATAASVVAALLWGWPAGALGALALLGGLVYNWPLKGTAFSIVPYLVSFGALPAFVAAAGGGTAELWLIAAAALLGGAAHLLNAVPDLADDAATGVYGLPHRLGARASLVSASALLLAATMVLLVGARPAWWAGAVATVLAVVMLPVGWYAPPRVAFRVVMVIALADVLLLVVSRAL